MNAHTDVATARHLARTLEEREADRSGQTLASVRNLIARRIGASPGFLENLRRDRIKSVPYSVMNRIRAAFVDEVRAEIMRLEHELTIHQQIGADPRDADLHKAKAQIEAAKKLISGGA